MNGHGAQRINRKRTDSGSEMCRKAVWQKENNEMQQNSDKSGKPLLNIISL